MKKIIIGLCVFIILIMTYLGAKYGIQFRKKAEAGFKKEIKEGLKYSECKPVDFILNQEQVIMVCQKTNLKTNELREKYKIELATWLAQKNFSKSTVKIIFEDELKN